MAETSGVPHIEMGMVAIPNNKIDGTGYMTKLFTAGEKGSILKLAHIRSVDHSGQANKIRWFLSDGKHRFLFKEMDVHDVHWIEQQPNREEIYSFEDKKLGPGWSLYASTLNLEIYNIIVEGEDFV